MSLPSLQTIVAKLLASTGAATGTLICLVAVFEPDLGIPTAPQHYSAGLCCTTRAPTAASDVV